MMPIIQLITTSIAPGTWKMQDGYGQEVPSAYGLGGGFGGDAGGIDQQRQPGAIVPFFLSISLIIKHTAEVHEQVADLLRQLRRLQDLQVSVEVRFITVNDTFFEFIGVDFDFQIQSDTVGKHSTFAVPNPLASLFPISGLSDRDDHRNQHGDRRRDRRRRRRLRRRRRYDRRRRRRRPAAAAVRPAAAAAATGGGGATAAAARPAAAVRPAAAAAAVDRRQRSVHSRLHRQSDPRPCPGQQHSRSSWAPRPAGSTTSRRT